MGDAGLAIEGCILPEAYFDGFGFTDFMFKSPAVGLRLCGPCRQTMIIQNDCLRQRIKLSKEAGVILG